MAGDVVTVRLGENGRLVIPAEYRKALRLKPGDPVVLRLDGDEVRMSTIDRAVERAQRIFAKLAPANVRLSDELLARRRREAERG